MYLPEDIRQWAMTMFRLQAHCLPEAESKPLAEASYADILFYRFAESFDRTNRHTTVYRHDHFVGYLSVYDPASCRSWIFGPALLIHVPNFSKSGYAERYPVSRSRRKDFCAYLETLPVYGYDEFLSMAICLHEQINGTPLSRSDVQVIDRNKPQKPTQRYDGDELPETVDAEDYSQMWEIQVQILGCIRNGDPERLSCLFRQKNMSLHLGLISDVADNYKATAGMAIALAVQAAVEGGLDYAIAMHTFDLLMLSMKHQTDVREILNLTAAAQREFALKVEQHKLPQSYPPVLVKVIHYIRSHLHEPLTAAGIAERTHTSQSYISKLFVKHTGLVTGDYIRMQKIEEAKQLLRRTDAPICDIAYRLAFSSQPQFQKVFKQYTGTTPKQYRYSGDTDANG